MSVSFQPSTSLHHPSPPHHSSETSRFDAFFAALNSITVFKASTLSFLLAFGGCLLMTYAVRPLVKVDRPLGGAAYDGYLELAQNLAAGNGYVFELGGHKVFHRPPLFPALLAPGMLLPEWTWRMYVALLNSALFGAAAGVLMKYARKIFQPRVATLAWLLFALNPLLLIACKNAVPAILQVFTYVLTICLTWEFFLEGKEGKIRCTLVVAYALALASAVMSHGTMVAIAVLVLTGLWGRAIWLRQGKMLSAVFISTTLFVLAVAPWTWRNYKVTGLFIPVVGNAGLAYMAGNAHWGISGPACRPDEDRHQAEARHMGLPPERYKELISFYGFTDPEIERIVNHRAREHFLRHPLAFARKFILNAIEYYAPVIYNLLPPDGTAPAALPLKERLLQFRGPQALGVTCFNLLFIYFALAGFRILCAAPAPKIVPLSILFAWLAFALPYFPFLTFYWGRSYYTLGTFPAIALLAAPFMARTLDRFSKARVRKS